MQNQQEFIDPPPPYQAHSNSAYYISDTDAWPSSYYRNAPRIDLAKFYHDILKASANNNSNSSNDGNQAHETTLRDRRVTFSSEDPEVFEYEAEYDTPKQSVHGRMLDDGWPGRAKTAMKSSAFIDFKSKIEAKLSAVNNDDSHLISEINNNSSSSNDTGYYRFRKSPLVQRLNLRPIPNEDYGDDDEEDDEPSSSSSPTSSTSCESPPETPQDNQAFYFSSPRSSTSSSSSTPNRMSWLSSLRRKTSLRSK